MSIEAKIQELQFKKLKIDCITYIIKELTDTLKFPEEYLEIRDSVVSQISPFLVNIQKSIEQDFELNPTEEKARDFTEEQYKSLVYLADRMNAPKVPEKVEPKPPEKNVQPQANDMSHGDKMNFAMNNRHLSGKRVQVLNDANTQVFGSVVGLDAPHVIVKTEAGPTINVPIHKINLA